MTSAALSEHELFGSDIAVGDNFQGSILADGTLALTSGCACAVQNIALRLFVFLGSLFYDVEFGSLVLNWVREESTPITRQGLCAEVEIRLNDDPHIVPNTVQCSVLAWDHNGVDLDVRFTLVDQPHPEHLVMRLGEHDGNLVMEILKSANPRPL